MTDYFKDYKTIETWQVTVFDKTKKPYYLQSFAEEVEDILYGKQDQYIILKQEKKLKHF